MTKGDANGPVRVGGLEIGNDRPVTLIAGPCVLESRAHALETSQALAEIAAAKGIGLIYKTSFDKANRTSATAPHTCTPLTRRRVRSLAKSRFRHGVGTA